MAGYEDSPVHKLILLRVQDGGYDSTFGTGTIASVDTPNTPTVFGIALQPERVTVAERGDGTHLHRFWR